MARRNKSATYGNALSPAFFAVSVLSYVAVFLGRAISKKACQYVSAHDAEPEFGKTVAKATPKMMTKIDFGASWNCVEWKGIDGNGSTSDLWERNMSHLLTLELPEEVFQPLAQAAAQVGQSPQQWAVALLRTSIMTPEDRKAAMAKLMRHVGAVDLGHPTGSGNEGIDADLAREYGSGRTGGSGASTIHVFTQAAMKVRTST